MRTLAMAAFVVLVGVAVLGQEAEPIAPIEFRGQTVGSVEQLALSTDQNDPDRITARLTAAFPGLVRALDLAVGDRDLVPDRDIPSRVLDVYWRAGSTRVRSASGRELRLTTRFDLRTHILGAVIRDARDADWTLRLIPNGLHSVRAEMEVTGAEGWLGDLAAALGLLRRAVQQMSLPLLSSCEECMCLQDSLNVSGGSARFSIDESIVRLHMTYSLDSTITPGLACFS